MNLYESIAGWYDINVGFVSEILSKFLPECNGAISTLHELYAAYPEKRVQLEYAFSTNVRGRALRKSLVERGFAASLGEGRRYLDVGCAYGGFLTAFAEVGYLAHGIEYDDHLASLCMRHIELSNLKASILHADFLADSVVEEPIFDLITCNDVIEHVSDPGRCIRKLYGLLKPGGVAYIETVNKNSLKNNTADIHFQFFGLNLLENCRAEQMYKQLSGSSFYGVSEFYPIEWYLNVAGNLDGASVEIVKVQGEFDYRVDLLAAFAKFVNWEDVDGKSINKFLVDSVKIEFSRYMRCYFSALEKSQLNNDMENFHRSFSDPIIRFVLRKVR